MCPDFTGKVLAKQRSTPNEYLNYVSQDIENAKGKANGWMRRAMVSHLTGASKKGWLTCGELSDEKANEIVNQWAYGVPPEH